MLLEAIYELNRQDPTKSEILIQGYGRLNLDTAKRQAVKRLETVLENLKEEDSSRMWSNAYFELYRSGVGEAMFKAIVQANQELEDLKARETEGI